jgi:hypothetical protein
MNQRERVAVDHLQLKMEAIRSSETSVNKIPTRRHIPEDGILHSHRRENLKSHMFLQNFTASYPENSSFQIIIPSVLLSRIFF